MSSRQTRVIAVDRDRPDSSAIADAAALIRRGGLVVFPTETVYGLGANALDRSAVVAIFEAKARPSSDPLIVHLRSRDDMERVVRNIPRVAGQLTARFWPGPLTLIGWKQDTVPTEVSAGLETVAVRVPAHPVAHALLIAAGVPIAAPSANLFSRPSPTRAAHVTADLDGRVDMVLDAGPTDIGVESTVLDLTVTPPVVRRPGGVSLEELRTIVPDVAIAWTAAAGDTSQVSPGLLLRHYAPRARMTLIDGDPEQARARLLSEAAARISTGTRIGVLAPEEDLAAMRDALLAAAGDARPILAAYGSRRDPLQSARELFDRLRWVDSCGVEEILAIAPHAAGIGLAIRDRLTRAAEGRVIAV